MILHRWNDIMHILKSLSLILTALCLAASCKEAGDTAAIERKVPGIARCVEGNCVTGRGVKVEVTGERYEGDWKGGLRDGAGIAAWPDGATYMGQWKDDQPHGKGIYIKSDGEKYEGQWEKGKRQGRGTARWPDGSSYTGDFRDDHAEGNGVYTDTSGVKYEGQFRDGRAHGSSSSVSFPDLRMILRDI